jgi:hypothetical protein
LARAFQADFKMQQAWESFQTALAIGSQNLTKSRAAFQAHAPGYEMLEIDKLRQRGIQPINR